MPVLDAHHRSFVYRTSSRKVFLVSVLIGFQAANVLLMYAESVKEQVIAGLPSLTNVMREESCGLLVHTNFGV